MAACYPYERSHSLTPTRAYSWRLDANGKQLQAVVAIIAAVTVAAAVAVGFAMIAGARMD